MKWLKTLKKHCATCLRQQSLQLDKSTLPGKKSFASCSFVLSKMKAWFKSYYLQDTDTKGGSVFYVVEKKFKEKDILLSNILACATDGAPSMIGHHCDFISVMKKAVPGVLTVHCVIHRQFGSKPPKWSTAQINKHCYHSNKQK